MATVFVVRSGLAYEYWHPGPVDVYDSWYSYNINTDPLPGGPKVGTNPLGDGDDATYWETGGGEGGAGGTEWTGYLPLPATEIPPGWTGADIFMRYVQLPGSTGDGGGKVFGAFESVRAVTDVRTDPWWGAWSGSSGNGVVTELYVPSLRESREAQEALAAAIYTGNTGLGVHIRGGPHRILDVWVQFVYDDTRPAAHNRIVQRGNDGLGLTGGQRVVQARTVQSSNRAFGIR